MPEQQTRKLVAILFADIQGYTSVMQNDEATARSFLRSFREELNDKVAAFNGKVINFYGDGCLSVFDSAVDATSCAAAVQKIFQSTTPKVPVRLGLHSGEVFFEDDNVYGDSVNLTSRIESMALPGSILISERIYRDIENQTIFKPMPLGAFEFKNVNRPLQIYALQGPGLVMPKAKELQGKGKVKPGPKGQKKGFAKLPLIVGGIILMGFVALMINFLQAEEASPTTDKIDSAIRNAKIAVVPFDNKTNDSSLDIIGDMAADWIIQGLMDVEDLQVVGFESIQENLQYQNVAVAGGSFADRTGAQKIVSGNFYIIGDQLTFQTQIRDALDGKIENSLEPIFGDKDNPTELVSKLQQKFVTIFAAKGHTFSPGIAQNPPDPKAYKFFRQGIEAYGVDYNKSRSLMNRAIALDSTFFWPYIWITGSYFNEVSKARADSVYSVMEQRIDIAGLSTVDRLWCEHWKALLENNLAKAQEAAIKIFNKDPKQWFSNLEAGIMPSNGNDPKRAVEIFEQIDPAYAPMDIELDTWWHNYYAHNLYRLGQYAKAREVIRFIIPEFRRHWNYYDRLAETFVADNQEDSLLLLMSEMQKQQLSDSDILNEYLFIAKRYAVAGNKQKQQSWINKGLAWVSQQVDDSSLDQYALGKLHYLAGQYDKAMKCFEDAVKAKSTDWQILSALACSQLQLGNTEEANTILKKLQQEYLSTRNGGYLMAQAQVQSIKGEKDLAINLVKQAFRNGYYFQFANYENDVLLQSLKGEPAFDDFVRPKS